MINGKKVLGVIPARGGSQGIPRKNLCVVAGKSLLAWTIVEARKSKFIDRLILSSEDQEIIGEGERWGCEAPFVRPPELSDHDVSAVDVACHAVEQLPGYDYIVLLQPPTPLRTVEDMDGCISFCVEKGARSCISITVPAKSPYWMFKLDNDERLVPLIPGDAGSRQRQDLPPAYVINGAVYVAECDFLLERRAFKTPETFGYFMPVERSIDIDSKLDLDFFEFLMTRKDVAK